MAKEYEIETGGEKATISRATKEDRMSNDKYCYPYKFDLVEYVVDCITDDVCDDDDKYEGVMNKEINKRIDHFCESLKMQKISIGYDSAEELMESEFKLDEYEEVEDRDE